MSDVLAPAAIVAPPASARLPAPRDASVRTYSVSVVVALSLILLGLVPTMSHVSACNAEAKAAMAALAQAAPDVNTFDDPHLSGMDPDAAEHAVYQATYRTCMQRNGF